MKQLETFLKLIIIGILTTLVRALFQGFIPVVGEPLLWPSVFNDAGLMPLAFMVFGSLFYTIVAALYLLIDKNLRGGKVFKGLKFSFLFVIIWVAYLLEPLPHVMPLDKVTYPLADSGALLVMGLLLGLFVATKGEEKFKAEEDLCQVDKQHGVEDEVKDKSMEAESIKAVMPMRKIKFSFLNVIIIGLIFFLVRIAMYKYCSLYSSFGVKPVETLLWAIGTGLAIGVVYELVAPYICVNHQIYRFLVFGLVFFGVNLVAFNGFMPVVFRVDMVDLAIRTVGDVGAVILGGGICLGFDYKKFTLNIFIDNPK